MLRACTDWKTISASVAAMLVELRRLLSQARAGCVYAENLLKTTTKSKFYSYNAAVTLLRKPLRLLVLKRWHTHHIITLLHN